ncbi:Fic family protein [Patescibacteria group bacterium]|nr:Fic family protein [Patescibacteria group bacterium]MBU1906628.1 Fic family protein [Patescibacteria group bacterium]
MKLRHKWLQFFGGLSGVSVKNKEWLNLLEEDTRHSLMIEGFFIDKRELREIIQNKKQGSKAYKVLGYFDAAVFSYEFAFQQYKTDEFALSKSLIRQIHALMFRNDPQFQYTPGDWRRGSITIAGSKVDPPEYHKVEREIDQLISFLNETEADPIRKAAIAHAVFEQIHPFPDGNGRVGRILLNFILVASGFPNVAIKGESEEERKEYVKVLEEADERVSNVLRGKMAYSGLLQRPLVGLEDLINKNLAVAIDSVICGRFREQTGHDLLPVNEVAKFMGKNVDSFRVACSQKKIICQKMSGRLMTHPFLLEGPKRSGRA